MKLRWLEHDVTAPSCSQVRGPVTRHVILRVAYKVGKCRQSNNIQMDFSIFYLTLMCLISLMRIPTCILFEICYFILVHILWTKCLPRLSCTCSRLIAKNLGRLIAAFSAESWNALLYLKLTSYKFSISFLWPISIKMIILTYGAQNHNICC